MTSKKDKKGLITVDVIKPRKPSSFVMYSTLALSALTILTIGVTVLTKKAIDYGNSHKIVRQQALHLQMPYRIEKIEPEVIVENDLPEELTDVEQLICKKWGVYQCQTAIAVAYGEGLNHPADGFNINTNNTIDVGIFRINSIHFSKEGCSMAEVITIQGNIDCAYKIWESSGWNAWVAYNNGSYQRHLGN